MSNPRPVHLYILQTGEKKEMLKWAITIKYGQAVIEDLQDSVGGTIISLNKNCWELLFHGRQCAASFRSVISHNSTW